MRKLLVLALVTLVFGAVHSQQRAQFTKYMFNSLVFNPAYAGSKEHLSATLIHRSQWIGLEGAPTSQSLTVHSPLKNEKIGLGLRLVNDAIGPIQNTEAYAAYAYRIPVGASKLSIGVQAGADRFNADWSKLNLENPEDPNFQAVSSRWFPNFGVGVHFYNDRWFAGIGVPHLIEHDYRRPDEGETSSLVGRQFRHYYGMAGLAIPLNGENLIFRPTLFIKNVGIDSKLRNNEELQNVSAPTSFDIDLSLFFYKTLWIGAAYRSSFEAFSDLSSDDSFDVWAAYFFKNGLRIGAAYDYTLSELQNATNGSVEIMLGYEFSYETDKIVTPRYF